MGFPRFTLKEILDLKSQGRNDYGLIFYLDETKGFRQTIDLDEGEVIVEKRVNYHWETMGSYKVHPKQVKELAVFYGSERDDETRY